LAISSQRSVISFLEYMFFPAAVRFSVTASGFTVLHLFFFPFTECKSNNFIAIFCVKNALNKENEWGMS